MSYKDIVVLHYIAIEIHFMPIDREVRKILV